MHVFLIDLERFYTVGFRGKSIENRRGGIGLGVSEASFVVSSRDWAPSKRLHQGKIVCFDLRVEEERNGGGVVLTAKGRWPAEWGKERVEEEREWELVGLGF